MRLNLQYHSKDYLYYAVLLISIFALIPLFTIITNTSILDFNDIVFDNFEFSKFFVNSSIILFWVVFLTFIFGVFSAYLVSFFSFYGVNFFKYALILSFAIPPYIFGYSFSAFFENFGICYSLINFFFEVDDINNYLPKFSPITSSVISLSFTLFGYVYILSRTSFISQSTNLIDLGKSIGFSSTKIFLKIIIPCARPGIFIGLSLVAMETLSDFGTVSYFGVSTFTTGIYNYWFIFDDLKTANFLSLLLLSFILIFFFLETFWRKNSRFHSLKNDRKKRKIKLGGFKGFLAFFFCLSLFGLSFILPFLQMLYWSFKFPEYFQSLDILKLSLNTLFIILITAFLIILFSLITNFGNRIFKNKLLSFISNLSISGYAIPGIIISVSIISFFSMLNDLTTINLKSLFIGSLSGLVLGYFFRFYSISYNGIKSNYLKINFSLDESSYLVGFNRLKTFSRVHWPIMNKNIFFIFILIALEIIKELPITLILRPFNFETFSTKAYNFASQDLIEAAAIPSMFLIFWTSIFILISLKYFFENKK